MAHRMHERRPLTRQEVNRRLGLLIDLALHAADRLEREHEVQQEDDERKQARVPLASANDGLWDKELDKE
jgi:hypothetical protein